MTGNRRVVIVSPYFPPSNLAGVHRARLLSMHLPSNAWETTVVCVHERHHEQSPDHQLSQLVPGNVQILKTGAISSIATRPFGVGDIGIRAYWHIEKAISDLLASGGVDLLFITASPYYNLLSGPKLKKRFKVPLVIDFQDPWVSRWGATRPMLSKEGISHRLARWLEPHVVRHADHVTSVSEIANDEIRARYPAMPASAFSAMPIGGEASDYEFLRKHPVAVDELSLREGEFQFSYVGTMLPRGLPALHALLAGLSLIKVEHPELYRSIRLNFVGTSAQPDDTTTLSVMSHAAEIGVSDRVTEVPQRLSYLKALSILTNSSAVLVIGSDEPHYSASKLHPALLSGRPFLAIFHERSSACDMVRRADGGELVTIVERDDPSKVARKAQRAILSILRESRPLSGSKPKELGPLSAAHIAGQYAELFNSVATVGCRSPWW